MQHNKVKRCLKCEKIINDVELHKIVMYVIEEKFTKHHYEHVECQINLQFNWNDNRPDMILQ